MLAFGLSLAFIKGTNSEKVRLILKVSLCKFYGPRARSDITFELKSFPVNIYDVGLYGSVKALVPLIESNRNKVSVKQ